MASELTPPKREDTQEQQPSMKPPAHITTPILASELDEPPPLPGPTPREIYMAWYRSSYSKVSLICIGAIFSNPCIDPQRPFRSMHNLELSTDTVPIEFELWSLIGKGLLPNHRIDLATGQLVCVERGAWERATANAVNTAAGIERDLRVHLHKVNIALAGPEVEGGWRLKESVSGVGGGVRWGGAVRVVITFLGLACRSNSAFVNSEFAKLPSFLPYQEHFGQQDAKREQVQPGDITPRAKMERAIRRSELRSPVSSPEPEVDPATIERLKHGLNFEYSISGISNVTGQNDDDEDLDFRLFATNNAETAPATTKIRLRSPTPQTGEAGFVNGRRPLHYYFTDASSKPTYANSAVSGADILALSKQAWPGTALPWKILHLPPSGQTRQTCILTNTIYHKLLPNADDEPKKRSRLGKKARIRIRTKLAASKSKVENAKLDAETKEAALREKRTRENRQKKLRKKLKEKAKKAGGDGGEVAVDQPG